MVDEIEREGEASRQSIASEVGQRLAIRRKTRKMSIRKAAEALRLTSSQVSAVEEGQWDRLGPTVYARGYVIAYGRLLGEDVEAAEACFESRQPAQVAPAEHVRPAPAQNWIRYQRMATYLAATALVAIPAVWIGKAAIDRLTPASASLQDQPVVSAQGDPDQAHPPVMASMTPVMSSRETAAAVPEPVAPEVDAIATTGFESAPGDGVEASAEVVQPVAPPEGLELVLQDEAWLEVEGGDGQRLAFGLMPAGSVHHFSLNDGLQVRIGNADQVIARLYGEPFDLEPFREKDLAKFELAPEERQ